MIVFGSVEEDAPPQPSAYCPMSHVTSKPPPFSLQFIQSEIRDYARRKPAQAIATAFGVGLLMHLIPTRVMVGAATGLGAMLVRPVLLSLGAAKAFELCKNLKSPPTQP
jgi:hypothetical protein